MPRIPKNLNIELHSSQSLASWMGRLLDLEPSFFEDDTIEDLRWDIAHFLFQGGSPWTAAMVVAGDLIPWEHGKREESEVLFAQVSAMYQRSSKMDKDTFKAELKDKYECLRSNEAPCDGRKIPMLAE